MVRLAAIVHPMTLAAHESALPTLLVPLSRNRSQSSTCSWAQSESEPCCRYLSHRYHYCPGDASEDGESKASPFNLFEYITHFKGGTITFRALGLNASLHQRSDKIPRMLRGTRGEDKMARIP